MKELSLHILDIVQNSIKADATLIIIKISEDLIADRLVIEIEDDGNGMSPSLLKKVTDPFVTSRDTRRIGLGLSLLKATARQCEGDLFIESEEGKGTKVYSYFQHSHIDRAPLGKMEDTLISFLIDNEEINADITSLNYVYKHQYNEESFIFDTREVKEILGNTPLYEPDVLDWIKKYLKENLETLVKS